MGRVAGRARDCRAQSWRQYCLVKGTQRESYRKTLSQFPHSQTKKLRGISHRQAQRRVNAVEALTPLTKQAPASRQKGATASSMGPDPEENLYFDLNPVLWGTGERDFLPRIEHTFHLQQSPVNAWHLLA